MRSALKWGGLVGVGAYVVARLVLTFGATLIFGAGSADLDHPGLLASACTGIFVILFAFSAAGYFTGRDTLRAGYGALAGLVAMAVYAGLSALYTPGGTATSTSAPPASHLTPVAQAASTLVAALLVFGIAALMGWLGARPAVQKARRRAMSAEVPTEVRIVEQKP
jgi:hypothetical protein